MNVAIVQHYALPCICEFPSAGQWCTYLNNLVFWAQRSPVQSLDRSGRRGNMRKDSTEILFQSFLQEAFMSSSGLGRAVHSLVLSIQHFLCRPRSRPPSRCPEWWFWKGCRGVWHARTNAHVAIVLKHECTARIQHQHMWLNATNRDA